MDKKPLPKVCWLTWLPQNGCSQESFIRQFGEAVFIKEKPSNASKPSVCLSLVRRLNEQYDLVAGVFSPALIEAIRKYRIAHYRTNGRKFAQWVSPQFEDKGEVRWCVIG